MAHNQAAIRRPNFLEGINPEPQITPVSFGGLAAGAAPAALRVLPKEDPAPPANDPPLDEPELLVEAAPETEEARGPGQAQPGFPAFPPPAPVDLSRLEAAIERLQNLSERLVLEARSDALEVALLLARKIVEGELAVNVDRLLGMVRSAVRRLGDSRHVILRLCPSDADALLSREGGRSPGELIGVGPARVELVPDPTLKPGDCVVEGDLVAVDGRLDTRFAEMRRALVAAALSEERT